MVLKTYSISVETPLEREAIEFLSKNYVVKGKNLKDAVAEYAINFYNKERLKQKPTLVSENELIEIAQQRGLSTGKSSVVQYRRKGVLQDHNGPWYYQNKEHKVVYNLEKMLKFLEQRSRAPKSRIRKKELALNE